MSNKEPSGWLEGCTEPKTYADAKSQLADAMRVIADLRAKLQGKPVSLTRLPVRMPERRNLPTGLPEGWNCCIDDLEKRGPLYTRHYVEGDQ